MTTTLQHPTLGAITGVVKDDIVQYLGVKYATLENRLAAPVPLVDNGGRGPIDATRFGPSAVHPIKLLDVEFSAIQQHLPKPDITISDTECLNLNITVPRGSYEKALPVFMFIHGGGYAIGSNSWPHLDQARIVRFSAKKNLPVIGVIINYRLGHLGFMTSDELRAAGFKSNRALLDQRAALQWIQKSIAGFGGNPDNVTIFGESAGGISSMIHLNTSKPLFSRAISMSGTTLMRKPMTAKEEEKSYKGVLDALEIKDGRPEDRINALMQVPFEKFLTIPRSVGWAWCVDGDFVDKTLSHAELAALSGQTSKAISAMPAAALVKDLVLGDCQLDTSMVSIFLAPRKPGIGKEFSDFMRRTFSTEPTGVEAILNAYKISPTTADDEAFLHVLQFGTDIAFLAPVHSYAAAWPGNAYVYHFNQPNPWDGPWKGQTGHVLDVASLFMNFEGALTVEQRAVGEAFAENFIKFFNGVVPWPAYKQDDPSTLIIGDRDQSRGPAYVTNSCDPKDTGRRRDIYSFARVVGLDAIIDAWNEFRG